MKAIDLIPLEPANGYKNNPSNLVCGNYLHCSKKERTFSSRINSVIKHILNAGGKNGFALVDECHVFIILIHTVSKNYIVKCLIKLVLYLFPLQGMHVFLFFFFLQRQWPAFVETICNGAKLFTQLWKSLFIEKSWLGFVFLCSWHTILQSVPTWLTTRPKWNYQSDICNEKELFIFSGVIFFSIHLASSIL